MFHVYKNLSGLVLDYISKVKLDSLIKPFTRSILVPMHRIHKTFLAAAIILGLSGCGSSIERSPLHYDSNQESDLVSPDTIRIFPPAQSEELPPIKPEIPGFWVKEPALNTEEYYLIVEKPNKPVSLQTDKAAIKIIAGYRIQLFAGRIQKEALELKSKLEGQVSVPVYLIYEAPQYKVRLGNYPDRDTAMAFCRQLQRKGFPGAWVVRSQIEVEM